MGHWETMYNLFRHRTYTTSFALGQRGAKSQPGYSFEKSFGAARNSVWGLLTAHVWDRLNQGAGVRMALAAPKHLLNRAPLHNPASVHHAYRITKLSHHPHVVGHHQHSGMITDPAIPHPLDNLRLHSNIQGAGRFIGQHQFRMFTIATAKATR